MSTAEHESCVAKLHINNIDIFPLKTIILLYSLVSSIFIHVLNTFTFTLTHWKKIVKQIKVMISPRKCSNRLQWTSGMQN